MYLHLAIEVIYFSLPGLDWLISAVMRKFFLILGLILTFTASSQTEIVLSNASIIDVAAGELIPEAKDIVISEGVIQSIVDGGSYKGIATAIDCEDKFVIPGLWDMHAHPDDPEMWRMNPTAEARDQLMPLFVFYGVTGIRDMAGDLNVMNKWRSSIKQGDLIGPEIVAGGPLIDGPNPMWDGSIGIPSTEMVPFKVDSLIDAGVDFLKIYSLLPDSIYFALSEYATKINFPFVGHVPLDVTTMQAAESGMRSQEHLLNILMDCSSLQDDFYNKTIDYKGITDRLAQYIYRNDLMIQTYEQDKAEKLFKSYVDNDSWHTPTISMWYKNAYFEKEVLADEEYLKYLPPYMQKYWTPEVNDHLQLRDPDFLALNQRLVDKYLELIGDMHKAGVKLLAGTDIGANPLCFPGLSVHYELQMFVTAGLSEAEALKTATINPAQFLEMEDSFGSIEEGKKADLVILNKNPLENIQHTLTIDGVIRNGNYISSQMIETQLKTIEDFHNK